MSKVYNLHPDSSLNFVNLTENIDLSLQVFVVSVGPFSTLIHFVNWISIQKKLMVFHVVYSVNAN